jgi:poly(3-hydroxybutyrate) depolymerase
VPTIVFHGDQDRTVSAVNGEQVIAQAKAGANLRTTVILGQSEGGVRYARSVQTDADGRPILEHWVLQGAGHAWSGGSPTGSYTDPRGPDASREMLRFFLEQQKPAAASRSSGAEKSLAQASGGRGDCRLGGRSGGRVDRLPTSFA